jgi:hypothetical protein
MGRADVLIVGSGVDIVSASAFVAVLNVAAVVIDISTEFANAHGSI